MKKQRRTLKVNREDVVLIAERAHEWLERLERSQNPNDRTEFMAWLKESPLHVREILAATAFDALIPNTLDPDHEIEIDQLSRRNNVVPVESNISSAVGDEASVKRSMDENRLRRRSWFVGLSMAICLVFALAISWSQLATRFEVNQRLDTATGEQRVLALSDGSLVHMNTESVVRINFSTKARDCYLLEGQAMFKVKHDEKRPFRVHVDSTVVQAIGTKFDVHKLEKRTSVAVIEGVVQIIPMVTGRIYPKAVARLPEYTKVPAGESVVVTDDGRLVREPIDVHDAAAWQERRLIFRNNTLAEMAAEFNRYNRTPKIRVEGEVLRARRFTTLLDADNLQSLLDYLSMDPSLAFDRTGDEIVIRMRSGFVQTP